MKLMTLLPESQRLRRIAKAHAVGEFSQTEYRQARRVLLDELARCETSPLEETFRRSASTAKRVGGEDERTLRVQLSSVSGPPLRGRGFAWFVGGLGALIGAMWLAPYL